MITDKNFAPQRFICILVVEDRNDPQYLCVRVRCIGIHTDDKIELPTRLTWAQCVML